MSRNMGKLNINQICSIGLVLRLMMLAIVLSYSKDISTGLLGSTSLNDDVRYLEIAEMYAKSANHIIDVPAFINTLNAIETGYYHDSFTSMWYWIVCVLCYLLRSEILLKIVNILFAVISIRCVYDICKREFGEKTAKLASSLYAFFPYPIIFSCFLYKDQFYTMITLLLFRTALKCAGNVKLKDIIWMTLLVIVSMLTRTGLIVLVVAAVFWILYKKGNYKINATTLFIVIPIIIIVASYIIYVSWEPIQRKMLAYVLEYSQDSESGYLDAFLIKKPSEIYRYPFSYFVTLLLPLNLTFQINNWMSIAGLLNVVSIPIAIGNILYLINFRKKKTYLYWIMQLFYLLTITTSLGIVRHQFYLQPFMMMIFAVYFISTKNHTVLKLSSLSFGLLIITFWLMK